MRKIEQCNLGEYKLGEYETDIVLTHNTHHSSIHSIIKEGLKPSIRQPDKKAVWPRISNPGLIYLDLDDNRPDKQGMYTFIGSVWGNVCFVISDEWVKKHSEQFKAHANMKSESFKEYARTFQIGDWFEYYCNLPFPREDFCPPGFEYRITEDADEDTIVSLKDIPPTALEALVLPSPSFTQSLEIKNEDSGERVHLLDILPPWMTLYYIQRIEDGGPINGRGQRKNRFNKEENGLIRLLTWHIDRGGRDFQECGHVQEVIGSKDEVLRAIDY